MGEWKLVPVEPTRDMISAFLDANIDHKDARARYNAMIAAVPTPSLPEDAARVVERLALIDEAAMYEAPASTEMTIRDGIALIQSLSSQLAEALAAVERQTAAGYCDAQWLSAGPPFKCGWQHRAEAAEAECDRLAAELAEARTLLEPFAEEAKQWDGYSDEEYLVESWSGGPSSNLTIFHLRAALASLEDRA